MVVKTLTALSAILVFAVGSTLGPAHAAPITYTVAATGTGSLGASNFTNALVTITLTGDTDDAIKAFGSTFNNTGPTTVTVAGIGTATFTNGATVFSNQGLATAGIQDNAIFLDILDTVNAAFASYDLKRAIGPLNGMAKLNPDGVFPTTLGNFKLTAVVGNSTFTATIPQPAPSTTTTLSNPTGGNVTPGTSVTDGATVTGGAGQPTPTGTVTFFLCQPSEVTPGQGCVSAGTQIGAVKTLSASGQATSDATTNTTAIGQYCWRVAYSGDGAYAASNHTDATGECFTVPPPAPPPPPPPPPTALVAAVLPSSRSVQVGITATAFVTILNTGPNPAVDVGVSLASPVPATFVYNQTDCATNAVIGGANVPVTIPSGAPPISQACFVISITPTAAFAPTEVAFNFTGINTPPVSTLVGINTLLMSASLTPVPDIVALAATATRDGILHITAPATSGAFVVATSNVGASGLITASANTGATALPLALSICRTDPAIGICISPIGPSVAVQINAGETPTFAVFATASGGIVLDAATNRIFVVFADNGSVIRGRTSVAVTAQ